MGYRRVWRSELKQPTPQQIRRSRERAGYTQEQAAQLGSVSGSVWSEYERGYPIDARVWELYLLRTNQHPRLQLVPRSK